MYNSGDIILIFLTVWGAKLLQQGIMRVADVHIPSFGNSF